MSVCSATNNLEEPYTKTDGKYKANIGNYHLDGAYGGYKLAQMVNEGGGIRDILRCGYTTKKDLYQLMNAYLNGVELNN